MVETPAQPSGSPQANGGNSALTLRELQLTQPPFSQYFLAQWKVIAPSSGSCGKDPSLVLSERDTQTKTEVTKV